MTNSSTMNSSVQKTAVQVAQFLNPLHHSDLAAVEKGVLLFNQHMVRSLKRNGDVIQAIVQDVTPVQVVLNLNHFLSSKCTCPADDTCRHMMAVFFAIYNYNHHIAQWLEEWRNQPRNVHKVNNSNHSLITNQTTNIPVHLKSKTDIENNVVRMRGNMESATNTYHSWIEEAQKAFHSSFNNKEVSFYSMMDFQGYAVLNRLAQGRPHKKEWAPLYEIVTHVYILKEMLELLTNSDQDYREMNYYSRQFIQTVANRIEAAVERLPKPIPFSFDAFLEQLRIDLREVLFFDGVFQDTILFIYFTLWNELFTASVVRKEELEFAKDMTGRSNPDSAWSIAYAYQLLLKGESSEAIKILERAGIDSTIYAFHFLEHYSKQRNWRGVNSLIPFFLQHTKKYFYKIDSYRRHSLMRLVSQHLKEYAFYTADFLQYEKLLFAMLPESRSLLVDYYYERKDYQKLMDFLQLQNLSLRYLNGEMLRTIQKEDPESLLPLYHHTVLEKINEKNRTSYKEAVRYLKRLRTIYKKMKKEDTWELYFEQLLQVTKRLRAFQEECQRGKLINVES